MTIQATPEALADAEQLAARYGYDIEALAYQRDRRSFGSFTTTIDGAPDQRRRYLLAWQIAVSRSNSTQILVDSQHKRL